MGGGVSFTTSAMDHSSSSSVTQEKDTKPKEIDLKKLPDAIDEAVYVHEKFAIVIDPTEQASRFLKYQTGTFINFENPIDSTAININRAIISNLQYGRTVTLKFPTLQGVTGDIFNDKLLPIGVLDRSSFFNDEVWKSMLQPSFDPDPREVVISSSYTLIICTCTEYIPPELQNIMHIIKIVDKTNNSTTQSESNGESIQPMDAIAELYGAKEIIRNSIPLVEAAFDGDLDEVKGLIEKGYHLESCDGRKHTALSEASCQGHMHIVQFLLDNGADPNSVSDTGRSPIWRAAFNSHHEVAKVLLEAGGSPEFRDKVSLESAYDVAQTDELRQLLNSWDINRTLQLMEGRRRVILANIESRIKTSAEREFLARNIIRKELVDKASNGDTEGIKDMLETIYAESQQTDNPTKPRANVEVRNDSGQSLLSIAAQFDYEELAKFLLTYWREIDKDKWELVEGEVSNEAKVFKANPNSRDLKGWSCVCIAVFHDSRKVLRLLLEHGGDPNIRSSYNKNAWDLAKDELDAAEKVIKSNKEIRQVLIDYDQTGTKSMSLFSKGDVIKHNCTEDKKSLYKDLDKDGSPVVMNIEMNHEDINKEEKKKKSNSKKNAKKGKK